MRRLGPVCAAVALAASGMAQQVVWRLGSPSEGPFGDGIAIIGDRDGDGHADVVRTVWIPVYPGAIARVPHAWVYSGRTGVLLERAKPRAAPLVSAGDLNGDGVGDYWIGGRGAALPACAPSPCDGFDARSGVEPSGRDDRVLQHVDLPGGNSLGKMMLGDIHLDTDGIPDLLIGTVSGNGGILHAVSNGQVLYTLPAQPGEQYGPGLGKFVDLDGDGCDEFLLGMLGTAGAPNGAVDIRSGRDGSLIRRLFGPAAIWGYGQTAHMIGDLDGDGMPDVVVGDSGPFTPGAIAVLGSVSGAVIWRWQVNQVGAVGGDNFGWPAVACVDVDRDGFEDVVANTTTGNWGQYVLSGRDGSVIQRFADPSGIPRGNLQALPPQAADPFPRWVANGSGLTAPVAAVSSTFLFSGAPEGVERIGMGSAGTLPSMPILGLRSLLPSGFRVTLADAEPGALALLIVGFQPLPSPVDLSPFGFSTSFLFPQPDVVGVYQAGTSWPNDGYVACDFAQNLVASTTPGAMAAYLQWVVLGSGSSWSGGVSEAMRVWVQ